MRQLHCIVLTEKVLLLHREQFETLSLRLGTCDSSFWNVNIKQRWPPPSPSLPPSDVICACYGTSIMHVCVLTGPCSDD